MLMSLRNRLNHFCLTSIVINYMALESLMSSEPSRRRIRSKDVSLNGGAVRKGWSSGSRLEGEAIFGEKKRNNLQLKLLYFAWWMLFSSWNNCSALKLKTNCCGVVVAVCFVIERLNRGKKYREIITRCRRSKEKFQESTATKRVGGTGNLLP